MNKFILLSNKNIIDDERWYHGIAINNPDNINADGKIKHNHGWQWHDNNDVWTTGNMYLQSSIIMTGGGNLNNNGRML